MSDLYSIGQSIPMQKREETNKKSYFFSGRTTKRGGGGKPKKTKNKKKIFGIQDKDGKLNKEVNCFQFNISVNEPIKVYKCV